MPVALPIDMLPRLRDWLSNFGSDQSGQGATEYVLMISVIVIALVSASYTFIPMVKTGVHDLGDDVGRILRTGKIRPAPILQFRGNAAPGLEHIAPHEFKPRSLEEQRIFVPRGGSLI